VKIQDILFRNAILIDLKTALKNDVLTQMGQFLASIHNVKDPDTLVQKILEREAATSTGIGYGIAIPHARTDMVDRICMVAARCVQGIEFNSLDEKPVHLIFMLASPADNSDELRNILSSLSKIMSYEDMREKLLVASDPETFLNLIIDGENKYVSE
jgi:fructose-specific phosphotransferase system IIA component